MLVLSVLLINTNDKKHFDFNPQQKKLKILFRTKMFEIPVFKPDLKDFSDFKGYVEKLERFYQQFGIVKVSNIGNIGNIIFGH